MSQNPRELVMGESNGIRLYRIELDDTDCEARIFAVIEGRTVHGRFANIQNATGCWMHAVERRRVK